jgi:hypothetical protein
MFFAKKSVPKKKKYRVVVKGITISQHSTKKLATKRANSIKTAKVYSIGSSRSKRSTTKRRRY